MRLKSAISATPGPIFATFLTNVRTLVIRCDLSGRPGAPVSARPGPNHRALVSQDLCATRGAQRGGEAEFGPVRPVGEHAGREVFCSCQTSVAPVLPTQHTYMGSGAASVIPAC